MGAVCKSNKLSKMQDIFLPHAFTLKHTHTLSLFFTHTHSYLLWVPFGVINMTIQSMLSLSYTHTFSLSLSLSFTHTHFSPTLSFGFLLFVWQLLIFLLLSTVYPHCCPLNCCKWSDHNKWSVGYTFKRAAGLFSPYLFYYICTGTYFTLGVLRASYFVYSNLHLIIKTIICFLNIEKVCTNTYVFFSIKSHLLFIITSIILLILLKTIL
jgi:hypothetical protein